MCNFWIVVGMLLKFKVEIVYLVCFCVLFRFLWFDIEYVVVGGGGWCCIGGGVGWVIGGDYVGVEGWGM